MPVNSIDDKGNTVLHKLMSFSLSSWDSPVVQMLLTYGADINLLNFKRESIPLLYLKSTAHRGIDTFLNQTRERMRSVNLFKDAFSLHAILREIKEEPQLLDFLVKSGAVPNFDKEVDEENPTLPLHTAVRLNCLLLVRYFISLGAPIKQKDKSGRTILHEVRDLEMANFLMDQGACDLLSIADKNGMFPIHNVVAEMCEELIKLFVSRGGLREAKDRCGATPFLYACWGGCVDLIALLLSLKFCKDATDFQGQGALHYAVKGLKPCDSDPKTIFNRLSVAFLLSKGCDPNFQDNEGNTPLHSIMMRKDLYYKKGIGRKYLSNMSKSYVEYKNSDWYNSKEELLALFLKYGANLKIRNKTGQSVLDLLSAVEMNDDRPIKDPGDGYDTYYGALK